MVENKKVMAKNILNLMIQRDVNAMDVCRALGFKQNTFSDWVNAKTYPRIDSIEKMANYFDVPKFMLVEDVQNLHFHTGDEDELLMAYRNASADTQQAVCAVLGVRREKYETSE